MQYKRVVITGIGPASAIGMGHEAFAAGLRGNGGIAPLTAFDNGKYASKLAAELKDFHVEDYLESGKTYLDRASEIAFAAMSLAIEDAGLDLAAINRQAAGLAFGSAFGSQETTSLFFSGFLEKGPRFVKPVLFPNTYSNTAASLLAIEYKLEGLHLNFASGFVASSVALLAAFDRIRQGREQLIFAGGADALSELTFAGLGLAGVLSPGASGGEEMCAPFDRRRNGFVLGEGGTILVLEEMEHARGRGARILGEILGGGMTGDGVLRAMRLALEQAAIDPANIGFISAGANGSVAQDRLEAKAIREILGARATAVPVTCVKPLLGETAGAAGALQVAAALISIETGFLPGILNLREAEAGFDLDLIAPPGRASATGPALVNAIDPGGTAVSFVIGQSDR